MYFVIHLSCVCFLFYYFFKILLISMFVRFHFIFVLVTGILHYPQYCLAN